MKMTPEKFKKLKAKLKLSGKLLAKLFGVSPTTISLYMRGAIKLSHTSDFIERVEAFSVLSAEEQAEHIKSVLGNDVGYQRLLLRETGRLARALAEQHGYEQVEAFMLAHYSRHAAPPKFDLAAMTTAFRKAKGNVPKITKAKLKKMHDAAWSNGMKMF